jgi:Dolichyl-phosphate-mannose-protein mannosyltransferase
LVEPRRNLFRYSMLTKSRLALILILWLGAFLRFYRLDGYGLWSDEFVTLMIVSKPSYAELVKTCFEIPQPMPPLYFLLNKFVYGFFPPGEVGLRFLSALSSLVTNYLLFALGRTLFSTTVGLYGSLLFAVNSTQIVYAQNARPYSFCLLLSSVSMLCFVRWLRQPTQRWQMGYLASTVLLFYTHYIFFPLLLSQNLYFWLRAAWPAGSHSGTESRSSQVPWKSWLRLQGLVAALLVPLYPQLLSIVHARHSLNWESKYPSVRDFPMFLHPKLLLASAVICLLAGALWYVLRRVWRKPLSFRKSDCSKGLAAEGLTLLVLWYLIPLVLFFLLTQGNRINLFVERYLIVASLPTFLFLPALALTAGCRALGHLLLVAYLSLYVGFVPATHFAQKGRFSQGVPGGNEWRETLSQLTRPDFQSPLFLFQSPFIESNQIEYSGNSELFDYLSAPLRSFYVKDRNRPFVLLPVHWWLVSPEHLAFKADIAKRLAAQQEFTLLSTQEFWDTFEPWLKREFSGRIEWQVASHFRSSGALRLNRMRSKRSILAAP